MPRMSLFEDDAPDVSNALRETARGISGGGNAVIQGLKTLATGLVGGAVGGVLFTPLLLGFGALALGTGLLVTAFKSATDESTRYAQSLSSLRASQGLSFNQGFALTSRNSLFGISPSDTAQMFAAPGMNPLVAGLRSRALGFASPYDPNALATNARQYQAIANSGPMGRLMANARLDAAYGGRAPDNVRQALNLRPDQIQNQLAYGQRIQGAMGIKGGMLKSYAEDIPLAKQRVGVAFDMAKVRFAVEVAPLLERSLTSFATLLANNAPKIVQGIKTIGKFLVQDFPPMVMRGAAWIARGLGAMLKGFSGFTAGLVGFIRPALGAFDSILNGLRLFGGAVAGIAAMIVQGVGALWNGIQQSGIGKLLQSAGNLITRNGNKTPEDRIANGIVAGTALRIVAPLAGGLLVRPALGLLGRAVGIGGGAAGTGGAAGSMGWFGRGLMSAAGALGQTAGYASGGGALAGAGAAPIAIATGVGAGAGIAAGAGLNWIGRQTGLLDPMVGFGERMRNGWGRARDLATGNWGHYDKTEAARINGENAARAQQANATQMRRAAQVSNPLSAIAYVPGRSIGDAYAEGRNAFMNNVGPSNLANNPALVGNLERMFGGASSATNAGANKLNGLADYLDSKADSYSKEMADQLTEIAKQTRETAKNTDKGAQSTADLLLNFPQMMRELVALTSSYIAQEQALSLLR